MSQVVCRELGESVVGCLVSGGGLWSDLAGLLLGGRGVSGHGNGRVRSLGHSCLTTGFFGGVGSRGRAANGGRGNGASVDVGGCKSAGYGRASGAVKEGVIEQRVWNGRCGDVARGSNWIARALGKGRWDEDSESAEGDDKSHLVSNLVRGIWGMGGRGLL